MVSTGILKREQRVVEPGATLKPGKIKVNANNEYELVAA